MLPKDTANSFIYSLEVKRDWKQQRPLRVPGQTFAGRHRGRRTGGAWRPGGRWVAATSPGSISGLRDGVPYFLEVNPLPGLSPTSGDLVLLAGMMGIDYPDLIGRILAAATERHGLAALSPAVS